MLFLASHGFRCIAHDRRGHGRSSQPWDGNDMDTYADDLAALVQHSTSRTRSTSATPRAEARSRATSAAWHDTGVEGRADQRVHAADAEDARQSRGLPMEVFDEIRAGVLKDRSEFFRNLSEPFYGANRDDQVSQGVRDTFWLQGMLAGFKNAYDCIKVFSRPTSPRSQEVRRPDAHRARRRRPDRADRRVCARPRRSSGRRR